MTPASLTLKPVLTASPKPHTRSPWYDASYLATLEADSHRPDVQEAIGRAIRRGSIRVVPIPGCEDRVRVVPIVPEPTDEPAFRP